MKLTPKALELIEKADALKESEVNYKNSLKSQRARKKKSRPAVKGSTLYSWI